MTAIQNRNPEIPSVVVVNDDITQLNMLAGLLEHEGMALATFTDAAAALSQMDREGPPDLIVTDLYMPDLDGWRFCRLLRSPEHARLNSVPILVVSATFSGDEAARITADLGANAFLPSPVDGRRYIEQVKKLLQGKTPRNFLRALIAEDDEPFAETLKLHFEARGYRMGMVRTVAGGIEKIRADAFDVAIFNYHLPDGPGDALLEAYRRNCPDCVCIMMTRDPDSRLALEWMKKGAAAYLRKPFEPEYLFELCVRARRERALLRVEDLLEQRTRELRRNEEHYRLLVEKSNDIIWTYDLSRQSYTYASDSVEHILGYPADSAWGKNLDDLFTPETKKKILTAFGNVIAGEVPDDRVLIEAEHRHRDGRMLWLEINAGLLRDEQGQPTAFTGVSRDITRRKEAEAERLELERRLHEARKAESLGRMAGAIAHNFNNLLGAVMGNLEMVMEDLPRNAGTLDMLRDALAASTRAAEISRLMLAYCGQIAGKRDPLDMVGLCTDVLSLVRSSLSGKIRIHTDFPPAGPEVVGDASQIQQVLTHLIENAREAIGDGPGEIRLSVRTVQPAGLSRLRIFPADWEPKTETCACVVVTDTGCGLDPSRIDQIFDPYYTTKFPGRGMGLSVVLGILHHHGGAVGVEGWSGPGSAFHVFLPLSAETAPELPEQKETSAGHLEEGGSVLLVDDETSVRKVVTAMLVRLGFTVIPAANSTEAVSLFCRHQADIRCVICDLTMPDRSGWETMKELRIIRPDVPFILASGYDEAQVMADKHSVLPRAFLHKPFRRGDLREALRKALGKTFLPETA